MIYNNKQTRRTAKKLQKQLATITGQTLDKISLREIMLNQGKTQTIKNQ